MTQPDPDDAWTVHGSVSWAQFKAGALALPPPEMPDAPPADLPLEDLG